MQDRKDDLTELLLKISQREDDLNGAKSNRHSLLRVLVAACVSLSVQIEENRKELSRLRRELEMLKWEP